MPAPVAERNTGAVIMQSIRADTLRGKSVRLRGQMRITNPTAPGWAGLWLRVDRTGQLQAIPESLLPGSLSC